MKCPKCGYNSFEYHSICKRCSADFGAYKQTHNITSIVLPPEARAKKAEEFRSASSADEHPVESVETEEEMFSFDLPGNAAPSPSPAVSQSYDPFNFDDDPPKAVPQQTKVEAEVPVDLPEPVSNVFGDPFASFSPVPSTPPAESEFKTSGPDEFDLENFSWDDTPAATATSKGQTGTDEFDSLFDETVDSSKK
jgi:predicted  nucleic acid-binding Zn-ribbon protein